MIALEITLLVLLHVAVLAGLLAIVFGLGGNFILLGLALLLAWMDGFRQLTWILWFVFLGLVLVGEAVEALLGVFAARGFGASKWGMGGAFVGGIVGAVVGTAWLPLIGSLIGAMVGGFLGAFLFEMARGRKAPESARAGVGAFLGRVGATVFKLMIGVWMGWMILKTGYSLVG